MITALGQVWHPEHFVCAVCNVELSHTGFFEREGRPYCDKDYHQLFAPRCSYCKGPILKVRKHCCCILCFTMTERCHGCTLCFLIDTQIGVKTYGGV